MVEVLQAGDLVNPGQVTRTARFDGDEHDAGASFFYVDNDPGQGVGLHWHPYSETWVVVEGAVRFRVGDAIGDAADSSFEEHDGSPGTIATVPAGRHHAFVNTGAGRLRMVCVHASPRIIQFDLE